MIVIKFQDGSLIAREDLTKKLPEIFAPDQVQVIADNLGIPLAAAENMTMIAAVKSDMGKNDSMGWRKHLGVISKYQEWRDLE